MTWCLETGVLAGVRCVVLAVSALPVQALVFVYGGVTLQDIGMLFLCHGVVAILTGSIGIFYSSVLRRSTVSTVCSYVTVVALTAGTMAVNLFAYRMALRAADSYASNLNASEMASSGILRYLFLFNPAVSFYNVINGQAGSGDMRKWFEPLFGVFPDNANHSTLDGVQPDFAVYAGDGADRGSSMGDHAGKMESAWEK